MAGRNAQDVVQSTGTMSVDVLADGSFTKRDVQGAEKFFQTNAKSVQNVGGISIGMKKLVKMMITMIMNTMTTIIINYYVVSLESKDKGGI